MKIETPDEKLRRLMALRDMRIVDLSEAMGVDISHAYRLYHGETGVGERTAKRLARVFTETTVEDWLIAAARARAGNL